MPRRNLRRLSEGGKLEIVCHIKPSARLRWFADVVGFGGKTNFERFSRGNGFWLKRETRQVARVEEGVGMSSGNQALEAK